MKSLKKYLGIHTNKTERRFEKDVGLVKNNKKTKTDLG